MDIELAQGDGYKVIGSGSVMTFEHKPLKITVDPKAKQPVTLIIQFKNAKDTKKQDIHTATTDNTLTITLQNYNNSLGTGTIKPVEIGTFNSDRLWMHFRVYALDDKSDKLFFYTFYITPIKKDKK